MKLDRIPLALAPLAAMLLFAAPALAEDPPVRGPERAEWCKQNPEKCQEMRAKREAFCKENPEKCEQMKQRRAERREFCKQNPEKCEAQRQEWKKRRAELQEKCKTDPAKCEELKQMQRERFKARHGGGMKSPAAGPPASGGVKPPPE